MKFHLSLLIIISAIASGPVLKQARTAEPVHRWVLDAAHFQEGHFQPVAGQLRAYPRTQPSFRAPSGALQLDGDKDWASVAKGPTLPVVPGDLPANALGIEAWVFVDRLQDWDGIASAIQDNGDFERGWMLGVRNQCFCFGVAGSTAKRLTYLDARDPIEPGNWYHVGATYDGARMRLYVDGRLAAESTAQKGPILYPPETMFSIGAYHDSNEHHSLKGAIASVSIYDEAIPVTDFRDHYQQLRRRYESERPFAEVIQGWPTYMRDNRRSGITPEKLPLPLYCQWVYKADLPPQPAWPPPAKQNFWSEKFNLKARVIFDRSFHIVSDGNSVFFGSSADDQVVSLDIHTGKPNWRFIAAGPVRLAPTLDENRLYVGSDDGHLYCLGADDGVEKWRFRAAPETRLIPGNNRIISSWPVRTGAVLDRGLIRIAAGLFPTQGTYQYTVDPATGEAQASGRIGFSPQGYMQRRGTRLMVSQGRAPAAAIGALARAPKPEPADAPTTNADVVFAGITAGGVHFLSTPGGIVALDRLGNEIWQQEMEGTCYSLIVTNGRLLASTDNGLVYCFSPEATREPLQHGEQLSTEPPWEPLEEEFSAVLVETAQDRLKDVQGFVPQSGYALVTGPSPLAVADLLRSHFPFRVVVMPDPGSDVQSLREQARRGGIHDRVVIHDPVSEELPYADNLFNLVYAGHLTPGANATEIVRVLRPAGGVAIVADQTFARQEAQIRQSYPHTTLARCGPDDRWFSAAKPPPQGIGQWTHIYGSTSNTSSSEDQLVKGPLALQWFGGPGPRQMIDRHHRTVPPLVAHGWMFIPGDERVICVDAYNGSVAWNTPVPLSRRVGALRDAGSMSATRDLLYIVADDKCHALSVATGRPAVTLSPPLPGDDSRHWGYVARAGDQLLGSTTRPGASRSGLSREQISETYYDFLPIVTSDSIFSMDRHDGKRHWQYIPTSGAIVNPTITVADGKVFFVESSNPETLTDMDGRSTPKELLAQGASLVALDLSSGSLLWRKKADFSAIQHHLYLSHAKGTLLAVGSRNSGAAGKPTVWYDVYAFDSSSGEKRWSATHNQGQNIGGSHGEQDHHPAIVGDTIYVEPVAYSIKDGQRRAGWQMNREGHGCGTLSASAHTVFFRAGTATMCDLASGRKAKVTTVSRPGCWINMIPANGMLLIPEASSGCTCDLAIQTSMAFAPAGPAKPREE